MYFDKVSEQEKQYLRELAWKQREIAELPIMAKRKQAWIDHNDFKSDVPLVHFEMWTVQDKGFNPELVCKDEGARYIEHILKTNVANYLMVDDDTVTTPEYVCRFRTRFEAFDLPVKKIESGVGFHIEEQIVDLEDDFHKLKPSRFVWQDDFTHEEYKFTKELFDGILDVRYGMHCLEACMNNRIVHLMGMENMFYAMYDYPELFHKMINMLADDFVRYFKEMEERDMLVVNNGNDGVNQGSFAFSEQLVKPVTDRKVRVSDCWAYFDSQETVNFSADMFHEFFYEPFFKVASAVGHLSYGCCEPVNPFWDKTISKLPNLRKVSISPWCDEKFMGERLAGSDVVYLRKPSPNFVGVGKNLDEDEFRRHIAHTLDVAKDCQIQFAFRDVYNLEGQLDKPRRAVEIVREEIAKVY